MGGWRRALYWERRRLLTAANDAVVTIWDLNEVLDGAKNARPRIAVTRDDLHSGGIFSAHTIGDRLVTASKDRAVVLSALAPDAIRPVRTFEVHGGVVKSAALRDACAHPLEMTCAWLYRMHARQQKEAAWRL